MRIQHNIPALNSHRNLGINNAATSKNLEKLSSGYRINRAGDDAAGLAISEKMRGQIRGLAMAEQNTSMGINLIQTAEGGLNETHAILQRMRELAVQSSNGTYQDSDRTQLTHEFDALMSEIDRIAESTHYNGIKLLDGSLGEGKATKISAFDSTGALIPTSVDPATEGTFEAAGIVLANLSAGDVITFNVTDAKGNAKSIEYTLVAADIVSEATLASALEATELGDYLDFTTNTTATSGKLSMVAKTAGADKESYVSASIAHVGGTTTTLGRAVTAEGKDAGTKVALATVAKFEIDGKKFQFVSEGGKADAGYEAIYIANATTGAAATDMDSVVAQLNDKGYNVAKGAGTDLTIYPKSNSGLVFQIGANGGADQRVSLSVDDMSSKSIGLLDKNGNLTHSLASASIDSVANANAAIDIIDAATDMVSAQRAKLGALQNRLEHTMNNLGVTKENLTASESTIRDVDMASEMMEYTKNSILIQASQAMLAQANQLPQGVLQLLR